MHILLLRIKLFISKIIGIKPFGVSWSNMEILHNRFSTLFLMILLWFWVCQQSIIFKFVKMLLMHTRSHQPVKNINENIAYYNLLGLSVLKIFSFFFLSTHFNEIFSLCVLCYFFTQKKHRNQYEIENHTQVQFSPLPLTWCLFTTWFLGATIL